MSLYTLVGYKIYGRIHPTSSESNPNVLSWPAWAASSNSELPFDASPFCPATLILCHQKVAKMHILIFLGLSTALLANATDYTKYVNLFIGTEGPKLGSAYSSGNVFPGAALPFGAVKVGIDTTR